jgi:ppGpp synthetase/RelA/SpoT-type nucleotidyltranferase
MLQIVLHSSEPLPRAQGQNGALISDRNAGFKPFSRKKLRSTPLHLDQIQDLAGCRAILPYIMDVRLLVTACRDNLPHEVRRETDYINKPKQSGYRSHYVLFNYRPENISK